MSWPGLPKTLRVGITGPLDTLDPRVSVDATAQFVLGQIFETASALIDSLRGEDDAGLQFSAAVRPEVRFSDGTLLTPEILARSLRGSRVVAKQTMIGVQGNRVWFRLTSPNPQFARLLVHGACSIVLDRSIQLHGTGPFMFDHHPSLPMLHASPGLRLVRNPYYHGLTAIQEVRFAVMTPEKLVQALRNEWIDLTTSLDPAAMPPGSGITPVMQPGNSTALLFFNTKRRPVSDLNIRRGIAAALDRHELAAACSATFVASGVLPPSMDRSGAPQRYDPAEARRLLDKLGARLTLLVPPAPRPYLAKPLAAARAIQGQLALAGVDVAVLETRNDDEYEAALSNRTYDLALGGCIATTPDPADFYDALFAMARCRMTDELPFTPLVHGHAAVLHAQHLHDVAITPDGFLSLANVTL